MHIDGALTNSGNQPDPKINRRLDAAQGQQSAAARVSGQSGAGGSNRSYVSAPELANLRQQLQEHAEVRPDVVRTVAQRISAGEFSGSDVALRTAAAILDG